MSTLAKSPTQITHPNHPPQSPTIITHPDHPTQSLTAITHRNHPPQQVPPIPRLLPSWKQLRIYLPKQSRGGDLGPQARRIPRVGELPRSQGGPGGSEAWVLGGGAGVLAAGAVALVGAALIRWGRGGGVKRIQLRRRGHSDGIEK